MVDKSQCLKCNSWLGNDQYAGWLMFIFLKNNLWLAMANINVDESQYLESNRFVAIKLTWYGVYKSE